MCHRLIQSHKQRDDLLFHRFILSDLLVLRFTVCASVNSFPEIKNLSILLLQRQISEAASLTAHSKAQRYPVGFTEKSPSKIPINFRLKLIRHGHQSVLQLAIIHPNFILLVVTDEQRDRTLRDQSDRSEDFTMWSGPPGSNKIGIYEDASTEFYV